MSLRPHAHNALFALACFAGTIVVVLVALGAACTSDGSRDPSGLFQPPGEPTVDAPLEGGQPVSQEATATAEPPPSRRATATAAPPRRLLPDLQTMPFRELYIEPRDGGRRVLRFSTTVVNAGEGPLQLAGELDVASGTAVTRQQILSDDGSVEETEAGRFVFHEGHEHWHFIDFTVLEVWTYGDGGELNDLVATTGKATFCAVDEVRIEPPLPHAAEAPAYLACGEQVQGISAGWSDTYGAEIMGQELDISALADGGYALRSTVDPASRLIEQDDSNNSYIVYVEITGDEVTEIEEP